MSEFNTGWIGWRGGECPVHYAARVEMRLRDGTVLPPHTAGLRRWEHHGTDDDAVAYRIARKAPTEEPPPPRAAILDEVKTIITQDRQDTHGEPEDCFAMIAAFWSAYLGCEIKPPQVAAMMALLKIARSQAGNAKDPDHARDGIGYLALMHELQEAERVG